MGMCPACHSPVFSEVLPLDTLQFYCPTLARRLRRQFPRSHGAKQVQEELGLDDEAVEMGVNPPIFGA